MIKHVLGAALLTVATFAQAADYPSRPVTLVVPFPPGGSTDSIARIVGAELSNRLGQPFPVENKPGATGSIGASQVARAAPDGYTLFVSSLAPFVVNQHLQASLPYNPDTDFDYITVAVQAPNVLVTNAGSGANSVQDVINATKNDPDKATFASSGNGSSDHLTAELFWQRTGAKGVHVPYRGGAPAVADLLGGQVQYSFQNINAVISHIKAGKLKALAVTSEQRSPLLPDVPTMAQAGVNDVIVNSWQAIAAPKGMPDAVLKTLSENIVAVLNEPKVKPKLLDQGFEIVANTPEEFRTFQKAESARWKDVIQTGNITLN